MIAVDLFGQPADYPAIAEICRRHDLRLIADSAQGFGCTLNGAHPLQWADVDHHQLLPRQAAGLLWRRRRGPGQRQGAVGPDGFPARPRQGGRRRFNSIDGHDPKYLNARIGMNSRLDTLQAAILLEKLRIFEDEIALRQDVATRYAEGLAGACRAIPTVIDGGVSVWAQYRRRARRPRRPRLAPARSRHPDRCLLSGPDAHAAAVLELSPVPGTAFRLSQAAAGRVLALPMHPYLDRQTQQSIIAAVVAFGA